MDGSLMSATDDDRERIEALERENRALREANAKLMRDRLGSSNTAAAAHLAGEPSKGRSALAVARTPLARLRLALRRALLRLLR